MAVIHEMYGIQSEQLENLKIEYAKLLDLVRRIKAGEVNAGSITIGVNEWRLDECNG